MGRSLEQKALHHALELERAERQQHNERMAAFRAAHQEEWARDAERLARARANPSKPPPFWGETPAERRDGLIGVAVAFAIFIGLLAILVR